MDAKARVAHEARITRALMRLGAARREKLDKVDYEAFVAGLVTFSAEVVERVCESIGRVAPEEFQPRFPLLSTLREACFRDEEQHRVRRAALRAPNPDEEYPPLSEEKWAEIRAKFQEVLSRRAMPGARKAGGDE